MSSGHYGVSYKINGHRIGHILRLGKEYHLVFERCYEENTLEEIEKIDWQQVIVEPVRENYLACDLPEGYSFVVKDINYLRNTDSFEVILEVDKQYWGDVTPYQAQVEALTASVEGKTAELAEKDEQLAKKDEALAAANGLLAELEATMRTEKLNAIKGAIKDGKTVQAAGGIAVTMQQSDKLGYDWKVYSVNDVVVRKEYIAQTVPVGTSADNPIDYTDGMPLINNAYYRVDGKIKVYMDGWVDWET